MTLIAQITDMHIRPSGKKAYGVVDTEAMLRAAVSSLLAQPRRPDAVIATGDLTDCGLTEEYELLRDILAPLSMPVYLVPGNHDRRDNLRKVFAGDGYLPPDGEFLHYTVEDQPLRLIALDTVVPGKGHGEMDAARLAWLEERLAEQPDRPTFIFMHHPPFPTGLQHMDSINCRNADPMAELLRRHPNVERVACGHHHRSIQIRWAGTIGSVAPSVAHQVLLDLQPHEDALFTMEPPGYHLHLWQPSAGVITHTAFIGAFAGPYPFLLDPDYPAFGDKESAPLTHASGRD
ncbi:3',5'-cyclic AMP phosphodiesterase CpdA [Enhydrobacter aerosaccus]|uniref:3',5'-cyclic AMP phosphodiesterase CpdA n=1 Tax=Enhydrobacter aerosaccus TaxID=225324 RepID=A0A1T4KB08_9HYPH|nr:phosphodiesterase [Enhydrobacter aerosaccus]SJZ39523.1 3',5'-cyclic AMP phosphodiesterase CpdA [Enhydrobacter aerosaccus]